MAHADEAAIKKAYPNVIIVSDDGKAWITSGTEQSIDAAKVSLSKVHIARESAYPTWQEQQDMQYWDAVNGTTTWKDAIAKVKSDYPKSS